MRLSSLPLRFLGVGPVLAFVVLAGCPSKDDSGLATGPQPIYINEFMASNSATVTDESGAYPDWIELFNATGSSVSLEGYFITDNLDVPTTQALSGLLVIEAGSYLLLFADGANDQGPNHVNFKLAGDGEAIGLYYAEAQGVQAIDSLTYGPQSTDVSSARMPDGSNNWQADQSPTAGRSNN